MKNKHLSIRVPIRLYQHYVGLAIKQSVKDDSMVSVSEIIREVLERESKNG